ncbi:MAG: hypothetical protein RM347_035480 [Nostoc sp. ChiQUE02]|uniref:hypothetical protein n=1 Tax=Nostoc sp. ChiQUE02 TaxID=3075377 RepID=UPI002AD58EB4|nr:hypothetical protein [Nostoc sp. ChiQUE02]MDZ8228338.1 hypothetical protein [Nostoc sp. ChiQUE02]
MPVVETVGVALLLSETLRVACFHVRVASRREVVRLRSGTTDRRFDKSYNPAVC